MNKRQQAAQNRNKTKLIMKGNPHGYFRSDTKMNFKVGKSSVHFKKVQDRPLFPTFNSDRKFYTPAFVLPQIETMKDEDYKALHKHKVQQSLKELQMQEILVPKPRSKHKYCGVCRNYYQQYIQHIEAKEHCNSLEQSKYQKIISSLCEDFLSKSTDSEIFSIQKNHSVQTKLNEDENSLESFVADKIEKPESVNQHPLSH